MQSLKIKSIKSVGKRKTYDLYVKDNHNFFLRNKILVHNSGKTVAMMRCAQNYHDNPYRKSKIFDVWGGQRSENFFWCLKSREDKYWKLLKKRLRLNNDGPKQYRVNLLYPISSTLPRKLPYLENYVFSKIFTIPFKDIKVEDIRLVLSSVSDEAETLLDEVQSRLKKDEGGAKIEQLFHKLGGTNTSLYKNFIHPLVKRHLLSSELGPYNLDIREEAKDRDVISNLCLNHIDGKFRLFIIGYFMRKVADLLDAGRIPRNNVMLLREAAEFFRITERSTVEDRMKTFKTYLAQWIRMGRRGMHLFADAQSPSETANLVEGSEDFTVLGKLPGEKDRIASTEQLRRDGKITMAKVTQLGDLEPGQYFIIESGKFAKKRYLFLPRSDYWKETSGEFYNLWKNIHGSGAFSSNEKLRFEIEEDFKNEEIRLKNEENESRFIKRQELNAKKEKEEMEKDKEFVDRERKKLLLKKQVSDEIKRIKEREKYLEDEKKEKERLIKKKREEYNSNNQKQVSPSNDPINKPIVYPPEKLELPKDIDITLNGESEFDEDDVFGEDAFD